MTEKERMDYYRKKYGFEPKKQEEKPQQKTQQKATPKKKNPSKAQPKDRPSENQTEHKTAPVEEKPKKKGFFRRLFGKRK